MEWKLSGKCLKVRVWGCRACRMETWVCLIDVLEEGV